MANIQAKYLQPYSPRKPLPAWLRNEDYWSILVAFTLIIVVYVCFTQGSSLKWLATTPAKWSTLSEAFTDLIKRLPLIFGLYGVWLVLLAGSAKIIGHPFKKFVLGFTALFIISILIFQFSAWRIASRFNLEPPLVALIFGLIVSNTMQIPQWLLAALRVEYFIKIGIILLGATLPLTLIAYAGPVAITQAALVSLATFFTIFFVAKYLGLEKRFAAVLGVGGAVCGVSASIAVSGAVRAKREHSSIAITLVVVWAIATLILLPFICKLLALPTGVAGAWIGTSEFADAAGIAAAQTYSDFAASSNGVIEGHPEAAIQAFTLMKVIGRDIWIGIWSFVLAIIATTFWDRKEAIHNHIGINEIWQRFPKFVIGFMLASLFVTLLSSQYTPAEFKTHVTPEFITPIKALRTWAFIFCFLSIGLSTRFASLIATGIKPFIAFAIGVVVNIMTGYFLSVHIFVDFWSQLGHS